VFNKDSSESGNSSSSMQKQTVDQFMDDNIQSNIHSESTGKDKYEEKSLDDIMNN